MPFQFFRRRRRQPEMPQPVEMTSPRDTVASDSVSKQPNLQVLFQDSGVHESLEPDNETVARTFESLLGALGQEAKIAVFERDHHILLSDAGLQYVAGMVKFAHAEHDYDFQLMATLYLNILAEGRQFGVDASIASIKRLWPRKDGPSQHDEAISETASRTASRIQVAIEALLGAESDEQLHVVLQQYHEPLLDDMAAAELQRHLADRHIRVADNLPPVQVIQQRLKLLEDVRERGLERAWESYTARRKFAEERRQAEQDRQAFLQDPNKIAKFRSALDDMMTGIAEIMSRDSVELSVHTWLGSLDLRTGRRYAESHLDMFDPRTEEIIQRELADPKTPKSTAWENTGNLWTMVHQQEMERRERRKRFLTLVREVNARGPSVETMRRAYVDIFGGFSLDLPDWLDPIEAADAVSIGQVHDPSVRSVADGITPESERWRAAITKAQQDAHIAPETIAEMQLYLASFLGDALSGALYQGQDEGINALQAALAIFTREVYPRRWSMVQALLGTAFLKRISGDRTNNLERAIDHFEQSLTARDRAESPLQWANTQRQLGVAYLARTQGTREANLSRAIEHFEASSEFFNREDFPEDWARLQRSLGAAHASAQSEALADSQEKALYHFQAALEVLDRTYYANDWARLQADLAHLFRERLLGERSNNIETSIGYYRNALEVFSLEAWPREWASVLDGMGHSYRVRILGVRSDNLARAAACFQGSLGIHARETYPREHQETALSLAEVEAERNRWNEAHEAYSSALAAEAFLDSFGIGVRGRDLVLRRGRNSRIEDAFALVRLGQPEEALLTLERGRARVLAEARSFDKADPRQIEDADLRMRFDMARFDMITAESVLNSSLTPELDVQTQRKRELEQVEQYLQAKAMFEHVVAEIREKYDPMFLVPEIVDLDVLSQAIAMCGAGHALCYLVASRFGGVALLARQTHQRAGLELRIEMCEFPQLTTQIVSSLLSAELPEDGRVVGGLAYAEEGNGFAFLMNDWQGESYAEKMTDLRTACGAAQADSSFVAAGEWVIQISSATSNAAARPLAMLTPDEINLLGQTFNHDLLRRELQRASSTLGPILLEPLAKWLQRMSVTTVTFIPCGAVAAFPMLALPYETLRDSTNLDTLADLFTASIAPSARSVIYDKQVRKASSGFYGLGNPQPTQQPLAWGEAEVLTLAALARKVGFPGEVRVQNNAGRAWLIQVLEKGFVVDAACHGIFPVADPLRANLLLAEHQKLTLGELLSHTVDLRGLRLFILSACQTAVLDLRGVPDEVRSLATGILQAGARAVLASHWPVDDKATYLLMARFAQEWFRHVEHEPPAAALARAQRWLRTVTNSQLQQWRVEELPTITPEQRQAAGSHDPKRDPWQEEDHETDAGKITTSRLVAVRGRGNRYQSWEAEGLVHSVARRGSPDARPYSDPIYWAGFEITGW